MANINDIEKTLCIWPNFIRKKSLLYILFEKAKLSPSDYNYENVFNSFLLFFEQFGILHACANFSNSIGNLNIYLFYSIAKRRCVVRWLSIILCY